MQTFCYTVPTEIASELVAHVLECWPVVSLKRIILTDGMAEVTIKCK